MGRLFTGCSTRSWAVHSYCCSTSSSVAGIVTNYQALDVDHSAGQTAFVARRVQRPLVTARLARTLVLCPKLRIVEVFSSWAVYVFDVAGNDSNLGVGGRGQTNCSHDYDCSQHLALPANVYLVPVTQNGNARVNPGHRTGWRVVADVADANSCCLAA
jgi:hypothetical protein